MKKRILIILALAACVTCAVADAVPQRKITVSGSAQVNVAPDEVIINAGVEIKNSSLDEALRQDNDRMKTALAFLKKAGIPAEHIKTDYVSVEMDPAYGSWTTSTPMYLARKTIEVKLTTITNLESVLTGLLNNGANRIHNINFETTQFREYRDQARALAIHAAKEKADALVKELGARCGKVLDIDAKDQEVYRGGYPGYGGMNYSTSNAAQNMGPAAQSTGDALSAGQLNISANVTASFELE